MTTNKIVLVPDDGTSEPAALLPIAKGLATLLGGSIDVLNVGDVREQTDLVVAAILKQAVPASLIVMPSRMGASGACALGPVAEGVLRSASCPVVLVGPNRRRASWVLRQLLLPHDGTPTSANAIPPAVDLAARAGAELLVLHVAATAGESPGEPGTFTTPRYVDQPCHEWSAWEEEFLARVRGLAGSSALAKMRLALATGDVGTAVVDCARRNDVDLIALAWRGGLDVDSAQTMRRIIQDTDAPVVVFRVPQ